MVSGVVGVFGRPIHDSFSTLVWSRLNTKTHLCSVVDKGVDSFNTITIHSWISVADEPSKQKKTQLFPFQKYSSPSNSNGFLTSNELADRNEIFSIFIKLNRCRFRHSYTNYLAWWCLKSKIKVKQERNIILLIILYF